jgi:murein DD-endopeptidase MepM/ murein hydrolase activator NlpD
MADPGLAEFTITAKNGETVIFNYTQSLLLEPGFFVNDPPLTVDPELIDPAITQPEEDLIRSFTSVFNPEKNWSGIFKSPAFYQETTSPFGSRRSYNENPLTFHTGVDFAGGMTLPIYAPADGKVVIAETLAVRGNATFIDHGLGVYSGFFHQNNIFVKAGDVVKQGDKIGEVGNTGRVNGRDDFEGAGAHQHWELWVNGIQVNPLDWLEREYP